jgi:hypothetical protein
MNEYIDEIKKIKPKYVQDQFNCFSKKSEFMDAYVELLKQSILLLINITKIKYYKSENESKIIEKEDSIIAGNLIRLIKLNTSLVQNICEHKLEICLILNRCITETGVNLKLFLSEGNNKNKYNYIKYSLTTEKRLWETIISNIDENDGKIKPIETRMKNSIEDSFNNSGFNLDEINRSSKWGTIMSRFKDAYGDQLYKRFFGVSSHSVHGNWQDILQNNLRKESDGFSLIMEWREPQPEIMLLATFFNLDIAKIFVLHELSKNPSFDILIEKTQMLIDYQIQLKDCYSNVYD